MRRELIFGIVLLLCLPVVHAALSDNTIAYWKLDSNTNPEPDAVGGTGLAVSSATYTASGKINGGYEFDGTNGRLNQTLPSVDNVFNGGATMSIWVYPRSDGEADTGRIAEKRATDTSGGWWYYQVREESGGFVKVRFGIDFSTTDGVWTTTSAVLPIDTWSLLVFVYDSSVKQNDPTLYIGNTTYTVGSGLTETSPNGNIVDDAGWEVVFGGRTSGASTFDGYLDEPAFYSSLLTASDVELLYNETQYPFTSEPACGDCVYCGTGDWVISADCTIIADTKIQTGFGLFVTAGYSVNVASGVSIT